MKITITLITLVLTSMLIMTSCGSGIDQKESSWDSSTYSVESSNEVETDSTASNQSLITDQEAMDEAYMLAKYEYDNITITDEDGNPVEGFDMSYIVQQPSIFDRDEENNTVLVIVPVMMSINGEANSGSFQYYEVDMKTGNCSKRMDLSN